MFLKNKNIIFKFRRSKVTDYAALIYATELNTDKTFVNATCANKMTISNDETRHLIAFFEPVHDISNTVVCATSKTSDQPAHTRSLIRAFASRLNIQEC